MISTYKTPATVKTNRISNITAPPIWRDDSGALHGPFQKDFTPGATPSYAIKLGQVQGVVEGREDEPECPAWQSVRS